ESHPLVLDLVVGALVHIDEAEENPANAVPWLQLHLASLLGFAPDVQREDVLALGYDGGRLRLESGSVAAFGTSDGIRSSRAALRAFAVLARTGLDVAGRMRLDDDVRREVENLVDAYLRLHTESSFPERVRGVADQMEIRLRALADQEPPGA
ncbi:DNA repair protein RecO, partial [Rubrivirga sp.]|uniref:DNA repair protein RecO n=1 Tax=Rubrivirga sp. TaxID=1885344 RepID=UPI003C77D978